MRVSARFAVVAPTAAARARPLPGDDLVPDAVPESRVRLGPVKHEWLAERIGGVLDLLSLLGLAHGLRERVTSG